MTRSEKIESEFRSRNLYSHNIIMLSPSDACEMIRRAEGETVDILGIDAFFLRDGGHVQPSMEHSCDYSAYGHPTDSVWNDAIAFVQENAPHGLVFEIVLGDL